MAERIVALTAAVLHGQSHPSAMRAQPESLRCSLWLELLQQGQQLAVELVSVEILICHVTTA